MPELSSQMYCSEQISIPPPFPYLLRQYAKAAIRTQPTDLLKWSTAYFRCLSLNIPPPVKPRLEYPIPRDYNGLTPGWLKALLYQLDNNQTVTFKILWDRWTGACLEHETLIKILCLGAFDNPQAIPWLRFVGICAAHLTDNLTHSMNLICEILTEEPEGGSATISLETFMDLYKYLAKIDASKPQKLLNLYFTDSLLNLWKDRKEKQEEVEEAKEVSVKEEESLASEMTEHISEEEIESKRSKEEISCPSLAVDDNYSLDYVTGVENDPSVESVEPPQADLIDNVDVQYPGEGGTDEESLKEESDTRIRSLDEERDSEESSKDPDHIDLSKMEDDFPIDPQDGEIFKRIQETEPEPDYKPQPVQKSSQLLAIPSELKEFLKEEEDRVTMETNLDIIESVDTIQEIPPKIEERFVEDEQILQEDLEKLKVYQEEIAGETDEEVEKYKCKLIEEMPLTESQVDAIKAFNLPPPLEVVESTVETKEEEKPDLSLPQEVYVDAIPGIGPIVAEELIEAVQKYMKSVATIQHGMVMPRNLRHYNCPPLESLDY